MTEIGLFVLGEKKPKIRAVFVYANPANGAGFVGRRSSVPFALLMAGKSAPPQPICRVNHGHRRSGFLFFEEEKCQASPSPRTEGPRSNMLRVKRNVRRTARTYAILTAPAAGWISNVR